MKFSYAVKINLTTGQEIEEYVGGIELDARPWSAKDSAQFPQATRQVQYGWCLIVDRGGRGYKVMRRCFFKLGWRDRRRFRFAEARGFR